MAHNLPMQYRQKQLFLEDISLSDLVKNQQEPLYVYSARNLEKRLALFKAEVSQALGYRPFSLHYAVKANAHPEILKYFLKQGLGVDVVSGGEFKKALAAGFKGSQIVFSGVGKTVAEIELALQNEVHQINVESFSELKRVAELTLKNKKSVEIALRVNPDVDAKTHPYISTGFKENKFGIEEAALAECLQFIKSAPQLKLVSLTIHIGSQLKDFSALKEALVKLKKIYADIQKQGFPLQRLDIGGGVGISYEEDEAADLAILKNYCTVLKEELSDFSGHIMFEPGRFLVARCGVLLAQIQYIKKTTHKTFVILNSGMHHLVRPALYRAYHRVLPVVQREGLSMQVDVVGPVCESSDFFAQSRDMAKVEEGDWLAICEAGAYGFSMVSLYNAFALPAEKYL